MLFDFFERRLQPFPGRAPEQPPAGLWRFCRYYMRGSEPWLALMALFTATIALIEATLFAFLGGLVDRLNSHSPATFWDASRGELLTMSAIVLVGLPLVVLFHSTVIHQTLLGNFPMAIRWRAHRYLLGQSVAFYQDEFAGRIATKVMQTALAVRETVMKLLDVFLYSSVFFLAVTAMAGAVDWRLSLPFAGWLAGYVAAIAYFVPRLRDVANRQADARSEMTGRIVDTYTNIATVKLFSHSHREERYARESMDAFLQTVHPQMRLVTQYNIVVWSLNALLIFGVSALGIHLWGLGAITTGAIAAAIGIVMRVYGMSQWIMWEVSGLFENIGTAQDGMETLCRAQAVRDAADASELRVTAGAIAFDKVSFHYGKGSGVIEDFTLHIAPGEKVGLVGRSGAGKSTLVNLLLRFFDLESGTITIDGQDISGVTQESLRRQIGMVTQDTSLLHRSVRDNLIYGRPDADQQALQRAIEQAQAVEFIETLSDSRGRRGLEAHVGERGVKLSGGQRQRVAIARVLLKDAPILVLDEATSALDSEIEAAIQDNLSRLMEGKTVIAIAHRLSTIAAMDRLVVIDRGAIVEEGTHAQLLAQGGLYAHLWAHQSGGFLAEDIEPEEPATDASAREAGPIEASDSTK